jgi:adenylate cyclase
MRQENDWRNRKVRFSINDKLTLIVIFIVLVSLVSITVLVSCLIHKDLRISAEENNREINRHLANETDIYLRDIRSSSRSLIQTISSAGTKIANETVDFFFNENPQIAALFFINSNNEERILINKRFFSSRNIDESLASFYFSYNRGNSFERAAQWETLVLNAEHIVPSCFVMFFPCQESGAAGTLFSCETLVNSFDSGPNRSLLINKDGDILISSELLKGNGETPLFSENVKHKFFLFLEGFKSKILSVWETFKQNILFAFDKIANFVPGLNIRSDTDKTKEIRRFTASTTINFSGVTVVTSIDYDCVFKNINAVTKYNIFLTIIILIISIIFIRLFSKKITIPLKDLSSAAHQVEDGVFGFELKETGNDEVGVLTYDFNRMGKSLQVYNRFTNREIALKAIQGEIKQNAVSKQSTVLFSEIHEFATIIKDFKNAFGYEASDKIVYWLNNYFNRMVDCIERTNGTVDKFISDSIMAHWGTVYTTGSYRKDAFYCIKAALLMRKAVYFLNKERKAIDTANPLIRMGCGINSGAVTAGEIGSEKRIDYTIIGGPVHLASRIKTLTKTLGADILISEDTWQLVGDKFITEEMPSAKIKGKENSMRIFAVINFSGDPKGPRTLAEVREFLNIHT